MKGKPRWPWLDAITLMYLRLIIKLALNFTNEYTAGSRSACEKRELVLTAESIDSVDKRNG